MEKLGLELMGGLLPLGAGRITQRQRAAHEAWMKDYERMLWAGMAAQKTTLGTEGVTVEPVVLERRPPWYYRAWSLVVRFLGQAN